jgi:hypothetical protein
MRGVYSYVPILNAQGVKNTFQLTSGCFKGRSNDLSKQQERVNPSRCLTNLLHYNDLTQALTYCEYAELIQLGDKSWMKGQ